MSELNSNNYISSAKYSRTHHKRIIEKDQQSTLFLTLSWPTFPLSGKWGDFVDFQKNYSQLIILGKKMIEFTSWSLYYNVKQTKTNLQKYFPPSFLNQLIYAHM